jgi:hypothetical protein
MRSKTFTVKITKRYIFVTLPNGRTIKELRQDWPYDSGFLGGVMLDVE